MSGNHHRLVATLWPLLMAIACTPAPGSPEAPAKVVNPVGEGTVPTVRLTDDAIKRLGLEVGAVESRAVGAVRTVGGEVIAPPGWTMRISAPVAGTVVGSPALPSVGIMVGAGEVVARIIPLAPQSDAVRAAEDREVALARLVNARAEAERIRALHRDGLASTRDLERTEADLRAAEATDRASAGRLAGFEDGRSDSAVTSVAVRAPQAGMVTDVEVAVGTTVGPGTPLLGLLRAGRLWVKVPIFAGDLARVDRSRGAAIRSLRMAPGSPAPMARPVTGSPSANTANASIDIYYELGTADASLRPGERVDVALPLRDGGGKQLVVPWSAVVRDAQGGAWVYERTGPNSFARRGVMVRSLVGDWAVLDGGPSPGTPVVIVAAAELFGTEFGTGK